MATGTAASVIASGETPRAATDDKIQAYERGILTQRLADVFESLVEQSA